MGAGWYLYLLWDDYQKKGGINPEEALATAKTKIMNRFRTLQSQSTTLYENKILLEDSYFLSNEKFKTQIEQGLSNVNNEYGKMLTDVDEAAAKLKDLSEKAPMAAKNYQECVNDVVDLLDRIINAADGDQGITEGSVNQIRNIRDKAEKLSTKIDRQVELGNNAGRRIIRGLAELQQGLAVTVAGYALEEFLSLSCITANTYGIETVAEEAKKSFLNSGATIKEDGLSKEYYTALEKEIEQLNGAQAKADIVKMFKTNPKNGTASGFLDIISASVQAKNYTDVSKIGLGDTFTEHSLDELNFQRDSIYDFFPEEYIINAAAGLGGNVQAHKTPGAILGIIEKNNATTTQESLAANWDEITKTVSVLSAIDAIAGKGILNSSKYYAIRNKTTGQTKIISTSDIIEAIAKDPEKILKFGGLGVSNKIGGWSKRYLMSDMHKTEFIEGEDTNKLRLERSTKAWNKVKHMINQTKIKIMLNASSWFDKS